MRSESREQSFGLACPNLSQFGQKIVEIERNNFGGVLLDYCLRKHGQGQGASRFAALLGLTHLFLGIANKMKHIYMLSKVCFVVNTDIWITTPGWIIERAGIGYARLWHAS